MRRETVNERLACAGNNRERLSNDEVFENDSDLGDHKDESGNAIPIEHHGDGAGVLGNNASMAHILAGYGTDICEQLIAEFM